MSSRFAGFRDLSAGILFWVFIIVVIGIFVWLVFSFIGNCTNFGIPTAPDIDKAKYQVFIKANGRMLYTDEYSISKPGIYTLSGYYEFQDNKFKWHDDDLNLDEYYYGPIEITKRIE